MNEELAIDFIWRSIDMQIDRVYQIQARWPGQSVWCIRVYGRDVTLGAFNALSSQTKFRRRIKTETGMAPRRLSRDAWEIVLQAMLDLCVAQEDTGDIEKQNNCAK